MPVIINTLGKFICSITLLCFISLGGYAQKFEYVVGAKFKRNFHGAKEVVLTDNSISDYSKELLTFPTNDAIVEAGIIYRPSKKYFIEARANYGTDIYHYRYSDKLSRLGFTGTYANAPLGPDLYESNGFFSLAIGTGLSLKIKKVSIDLGASMVWQPGSKNGTDSTRIGIYENNQRRWVAESNDLHTHTTHFYQKIFARFFIQESKYRLFKHLGYEVGYTNRFFNRYKNSVMDVTYTDRNNITFVNQHYDLQRSLYFSVLYRF